MKHQLAWAIVTRKGTLAVLSGQCPIFWCRKVALREMREWIHGPKDREKFHVEKISIAVPKP